MKKIIAILGSIVLGVLITRFLVKKKSVEDKFDEVEYIDPDTISEEDIDVPVE